MSITLDSTRCRNCGLCAKVCIINIFRANDNGTPTLQENRLENCLKCGHCVAVCPHGAISLDGVQPESLQPIVKAPLDDTQRAMLFAARRSLRQYKPDAVEPALLEKALSLASYAPTARNMREIGWTIINGREKLLPIIAQAADALEETGKLHYASIKKHLAKGYDPILRGAPCLILAHCKPWRWDEADCAIAISYMELALHSLGLGVCWAGMIVNAQRQRILSSIPLPEGHALFAGLMVGYPAVSYARIPERKLESVTWL